MHRILTVLVLVALAVSATAHGAGDESGSAVSAAPDTTKVTPTMRVSKLFEARCIGCHSGNRPAAGLDLSPGGFAEALVGIESRKVKQAKLVDLEFPGKSYLLVKLRGENGIRGDRMPLRSAALSFKEIGVVEEWIRDLAEAAAAASKEKSDDAADEAEASEDEELSGATGAAAGATLGAADAADEGDDEPADDPGKKKPPSGE